MTQDKEIDLVKLFQIILRGKKKIIIIIIISIFLAFGIYKNQPVPAGPSIKSTVEIKPLDESQLIIFELFNSLEIYDVNSGMLYSHYVKILNERTAYKKALKKFEIISKKNYENNEKYEEALTMASYKMTISTNDGTYMSFSLAGDDKKKSLEIMKYIRDENNRILIKDIEQQIKYRVSLLKKFDEIKKTEIKIEIQDRKDEFDLKIKEILQNLKFRIEDIDIAIQNSIDDYDYRVSKKLQFLEEQTSIARRLDISAPVISNLRGGYEDNNLFFLLGYLAIEKEMEIIKNRKDIDRYAANEKLLKTKRTLLQDKSVQRKELNKLYLDNILILEKRLIKIDRNKKLYSKVINVFNETFNQSLGNFESVVLDPYSADFKIQKTINNSFTRMLVLAIFLGLIIGLIYIIIEENIKKVVTRR